MSHSVAFAISLGFLWLLTAIVQYISTGNLYVLLILLLASLFFFLKALHLYLKRSKKSRAFLKKRHLLSLKNEE